VISPDRAVEPTATSALRLLAVPSLLRSSAAAQRGRWAACASSAIGTAVYFA
jgi:hypothetical protein